MLKGPEYSWRVFVGAALLLLQFLTVFLPRMSISGEDYIDMAADANQYAVQQDKEAAAETGAAEIVSLYGKKTETYDSAAEHYDRMISERLGGKTSISGLFLGRWGLTVSNTLYFDGLTCPENARIEDSGVQGPLRWMGIFLFLPVILAISFMVFILVRGRTYPVLLLVSGVITCLSEIFLYFLIPNMVWKSAEGYVSSLSLIDSGVLAIDGVGERAVNGIFHGFGTGTPWFSLVLGFSAMVAGIVFLVLGYVRKKEDAPAPDYDKVFNTLGMASAANTLQNDLTKAGQIAVMGRITGISGQYHGQSLEIQPGEELVFGRDPRYSMLIFDNAGISRRHCGIRYDSLNGVYQVIDYSSSGTRLADGTLISASVYTPVRRGSVLYLGNGAEAFLLE